MKPFATLVLFLLLAIEGLSQNAPMSPNVSSAEGLFKTDIYSGAPNLDVPIYTFTSRDIQVPIELNYTGGNGIRVAEEAGWVGLGWHLQAGGFIAQMVRGFDDFGVNGFISTNTPNSGITVPCVTGQVNLTTLPGSTDCNNIAVNATLAQMENMDLEPDMFFLSLPGVNVQFFFDRYQKIFYTTQTNVSVSLNYSSTSSDPVTFSVSTPDGLYYNFMGSGRELATDVTLPKSGDQRVTDQGSTWYLTNITSSTSGEQVNFAYTSPFPATIQTVYSKTVYQTTPGTNDQYIAEYKEDLTGFQLFNSQVQCSYPVGGKGGSTTLTLDPVAACASSAGTMSASQTRQISRNPIYLSEIYGTSGAVYFTTAGRGDMAGGAQQLSKITVNLTDQLSKQSAFTSFAFTYGLFNSDNTNPTGTYYSYYDPQNLGLASKRLKLQSVQQSSGDLTQSLPKYNFTYVEATGLNLPYKTSFDLDHWGYYNYVPTSVLPNLGHNTDLASVGMTGINRSSATYVGASTIPLAAANMLLSVQTPSGGTTTFDYEASGAGVRVTNRKQWENTLPNAVADVLHYVYTSNPNYSMVPTYTYQVSSQTNYTGTSCTDATNKGYVDNAPTIVGVNRNTTATVPQAYYYCTFNAYSSTSPFSFTDLNALSPTNYTMVTEYKGPNGELGKSEYYYPSIVYNTTQYPFVPVPKNPMEGQLYKVVVYKNVAGAYHKVSQHSYAYTFPTMNWSIRTDGTPPPFDGTLGIPTTSNGIKLGLSYAQPSPIVYAVGYIMYTGTIVSKTTSTTLFDQADETLTTSATTLTEYYDTYGQVKQSLFNDNAPSGLSRYTRTYRPSEAPGNHSGTDHLPTQILTFKYSGTFNTTTPATYTVKSYWAEYYSWWFVTMGNKWVSNTKVTNPGLKDAGFRKVLANTFDGSAATGQGQGNLTNQQVMLTDGAYTDNFMGTSTLWGYNNRYPVAVAVNADPGTFAYNGFEDGTNSTGAKNWTGYQTGTFVDKLVTGTDPSNVFSGRFSYSLTGSTGAGSSNTSFSYLMNPPTPGRYKLSCWMKIPATTGTVTNNVQVQLWTTDASGNYSPSNQTGVLRSASPDYTFNDWQYVEAVMDYAGIMSGYSSNKTGPLYAVIYSTCSYNVLIDDIRLQPVDAQMTTTTYSPGIGKTSEAGPDGKPVHYEYDAFGRLLYVRDFRRNILKKNQYFYK